MLGYYNAECLKIEEVDSGDSSELIITFRADPHKYGGTAYSAAYTPPAAADVTAENTGTFPVIPTISCEAAATVVYGGNTYALGVGDHTSHLFTLQPGANEFTVTSTGAVTISWRTEVL